MKDENCKHTKVEDVGYTGTLPSISGIDLKLWDAHCLECNERVYAKTTGNNEPIIRWNYDRTNTHKWEYNKA